MKHRTVTFASLNNIEDKNVGMKSLFYMNNTYMINAIHFTILLDLKHSVCFVYI